MNIAFIGDSFCANTGMKPYKSFQYFLTESNDIDIITAGIAGSSLFHAYDVLFEDAGTFKSDGHTKLDIADVIVFFITEPSRIVNRHGLPLCHGALQPGFELLQGSETWSEYYGIPESNLKIIMKSASMYFENIMNYDFTAMAQKGILMQIDELMLEKKKKCIWFSCFDDSMQGFIPKSGPVGDTLLRYISRLELLNLVKKGKTKPGDFAMQVDYAETITVYQDLADGTRLKTSDTNDERQNHLSPENNINMFNLIRDIINNDDFTPREIKMVDYFETLQGVSEATEQDTLGVWGNHGRWQTYL